MWCRVELCCDDTGRKLPRAEWRPIGAGRLDIGPGSGPLAGVMVANLTEPKTLAQSHERQLAWPLSDVRVRTYSTGLLVIGLQAVAEGGVVREVRQAWYCTAAEPAGDPRAARAVTPGNRSARINPAILGALPIKAPLTDW